MPNIASIINNHMHFLVKYAGPRRAFNHWPIATILFLIHKSVNLLKRNKLYFTLHEHQLKIGHLNTGQIKVCYSDVSIIQIFAIQIPTLLSYIHSELYHSQTFSEKIKSLSNTA